ncbi:hypothetical protein [Lishizhenia sp.]|uniref:hypothetical protein n=1 Tax=Lishizhenia sp. TaxID=2497594 RepID=UPI00299E253C|nr:hypothetical protein [Lishizhenia sp.]MDX1445625.1 hypothetical protein [Lishizhenia sp.]
MKKYIAVALAIMSLALSLNAQEVGRVHTIYGEAFGQGFVYGSLHYEQKMKDSYNGYQTAGANLVYMPKIAEFGNGTYYGFGLNWNWIYGKENHHFTTGIGSSIMLSDGADIYSMGMDWYVTPNIGYRYQPRNGGLFLSARINAMIGLAQGNVQSSTLRMNNFETLDIARIFPWPGLALGWSF